MSRGFLIYSHINEKVDYNLLAICCATTIKRNIKTASITLVSDEASLDHLKDLYPKHLPLFDHIIVQPYDQFVHGRKEVIYDSRYTPITTDWFVTDRVQAHDLSPYDETILIDSDVLVADKALNSLWGSLEPYLFPKPLTLLNTAHDDHERLVGPFGIVRERTTILYFRKTEEAKLLFDLAAHVRDHYEFYSWCYGLTEPFKNDIAFSIASHMLNGYKRLSDDQRLPFSFFTSGGYNELFDAVGNNEYLVLMNDEEDGSFFNVNRVKGITLHMRNPLSILRQASKIIGGFDE